MNDYYKKLATPPADALKTITGGKLAGFIDISPQWRIEKMSEVFGTCGIGWRYTITKTETYQSPNGEIILFMMVEVHIKENEEWSAPIIGCGGDMIIQKSKNELVVNPESFKMCLTDALGNALKNLGVAADVYRGMMDTKYNKSSNSYVPAPTEKSSGSPSQGGYTCKKCGNVISENVQKFSIRHYGQAFCMECQRVMVA